MEENTLIISNDNYGEYAAKLNIHDEESFNRLLEELRKRYVDRELSGFIEYEGLNFIEKTLAAFDRVIFDERNISMMVIKNWDNLRQRINPDITETECFKWVLNGMINKISKIIDENIRYGSEDDFYKNLRDFLCIIDIKCK